MFAIRRKSNGRIATSQTGTAEGDVRQLKIEQWTKNCGEPVEYVSGTDEEIADLWKAQNEADATYLEKRKAEYAPIPEQLDYIYHHGIEKWKTDMVLPVKEKYPKGDS